MRLTPLAMQVKYSDVGIHAVGRGVVALPVAQQLENEQRAIRRSWLPPRRGDPRCLLLREAIQELTHPDRVGACGQRDRGSSRSTAVTRMRAACWPAEALSPLGGLAREGRRS